MDCENVSGKWRHNAGDDWFRLVQHPLVVSAGDGSLSFESFSRYLVNCYIFMINLSRAWAMLIAHAEKHIDMSSRSRQINHLLSEQISLYETLSSRCGIDRISLFQAREHPFSAAYARYLMETGRSGDVLDMLSVLTPAAFGYAEAGIFLEENAWSDTYAHWYSAYSDREYQEGCQMINEMIDEACSVVLGDAPQEHPRWNELSSRFAVATRFEVGFLDVSLSG